MSPSALAKLEPATEFGGVEAAFARRSAIIRLGEGMLAAPEAQVEIPTVHYHAEGVYAREVFISAGTALVGKIHKTEHINVVSMGKIVVVTEEGRKIISAPFTFVAPPGTMRAGFALQDTVWTTFHPASTRDLVQLEDELIAQSYEEFLALTAAPIKELDL